MLTSATASRAEVGMHATLAAMGMRRCENVRRRRTGRYWLGDLSRPQQPRDDYNGLRVSKVDKAALEGACLGPRALPCLPVGESICGARLRLCFSPEAVTQKRLSSALMVRSTRAGVAGGGEARPLQFMNTSFSTDIPRFLDRGDERLSRVPAQGEFHAAPLPRRETPRRADGRERMREHPLSSPRKSAGSRLG